MAKITKSLRGEKVDFDLFAIKQQIAAAPITENVNRRERFINKKRRRTNKNRIEELGASRAKKEAAIYDAAIAANPLEIDAGEDALSVEETQVDSKDESAVIEKKKRRVQTNG